MKTVVNDLVNDIREMESFDCQKNFEKTQKRINKFNFRRRMSIAASFITAAVVAVVAIVLYNGNDDQELLAVQAPVGEVLTVVLPDSTIVYLNSGSTLTYPKEFAKDKREVSLEGQGWFKVYASRAYPFYVNISRGMSLYVYGTEFDVAAYPEEKDIEIYLASGNLNMLLPLKDVECSIKPNQKLTYDTLNESIDVENLSDGMGYDWKGGNLYFRHSNMSEILTTLSRRFDVIIDVENASADSNEYHASFTASESIEQILSQLSGLSGLKWHNVGIDAEGRKHITVKY